VKIVKLPFKQQHASRKTFRHNT